MPPASEERDGDDDSEVADSDAVRADSHRPQDPVLTLVRVLDRVLREIDRLYVRFDELPGRVQFGVAFTSFLSSVYFGRSIKRTLDSVVGTTLTGVLTEFTTFSLGVQIALSMLALLVVQVMIANESLTKVVEIVDGMTGDDDTATDGGVQTRNFETTGAWAQGGAGLGAIFGGLFGYTSTIFGGMIFGAIVGNLAEEWSAKRRKRRRMKTKVVEYLLRERIFAPQSVESKTVRNWFPADDEEFVFEAVEELVQDADSPVRRTPGGIHLVGASEAVTYLDRNGGRIPSAFAGPNRPPRPSGDRE